MVTWKARPTVYRGVMMRSRLEARFAGDLDAAGWLWEYEPRAYADGRLQWLPDFQIPESGSRPLFIEVKPTREAAHETVLRVYAVFASEPSAVVCVVWPENSTDDLWHTIVVGEFSDGEIDYVEFPAPRALAEF